MTVDFYVPESKGTLLLFFIFTKSFLGKCGVSEESDFSILIKKFQDLILVIQKHSRVNYYILKHIFVLHKHNQFLHNFQQTG